MQGPLGHFYEELGGILRILVNALSARLGGGQTYLRNLLLHAPPAPWQIFVLCPDNFDLRGVPPNVERVETRQDLNNPYRRALWENLHLGALLRKLGAEILFSPGGLLPGVNLSAGVKTVVTFQNMLPYDHAQRQRYPWGARRVRDWLLERGLSAAMRQADLVIFISRFASDFIQTAIGPLGGRQIVIPHGIDKRFIADPLRRLPRPSIAPNGEYYLYVSYIDFYKSQIEVVKAFSALRREGLAPGILVLAGSAYPPYLSILKDLISRLSLNDAVFLAGNLPHEKLPALYQYASFNLFASRTENCPNILMEIMAAGRPALVSNIGPMPEFAGNTVRYFDPEDPESIAEAWRRSILNYKEAEELACHAKARISGSSWERASRSTWDNIVQLCTN